MKEFFLSDCCQHENKVITSSFVVVSKQVKPKKTGEPYLALTSVIAPARSKPRCGTTSRTLIDAFEQDDFVKVKGLLNKYKNRFQITIHKLRRLGDSEIDFSDYLPKTTKDIGELWQTLAAFVASFRESASQVSGGSLHGRPGDCRGLPQRSRRQDAASRLHRRIARSRGFALAVPAT